MLNVDLIASISLFFDLKGSLDKNAKDYYKEEISKYGYVEAKKQNWILNIIGFILGYGMWIVIFIVSNFGFKLLLADFLIYPLIFMYFMGKIDPKSVESK